MNIKKSIKSKLDKLALKIDKLDDNYDTKYLRLNNKNLVLIPKDDKYVLAVIASPQTKRWIATNMDVKCGSKEYGKVAYFLDGTPNALEIQKEEGNHYKIPTYLFQGKEVAPLFDYSPESQRLFWTIKKFDSLAKYGKEEKLSIVNLICMQDEIDADVLELARKEKEAQEAQNASEEELTNEDEEALTF